MCPLNDGIFYWTESATHQEEDFLKHDHYYETLNTFVSVNNVGNLLKFGLTV